MPLKRHRRQECLPHNVAARALMLNLRFDMRHVARYGFWAVTVRANWRVTFHFDDGAEDVDYH